MRCPSIADLLDAAGKELYAETQQEESDLPFDPAVGLLVLLWLAALAARLVLEAQVAEDRRQPDA